MLLFCDIRNRKEWKIMSKKRDGIDRTPVTSRRTRTTAHVIPWAGRSLYTMSEPEIDKAKKFLVEAWTAGLPDGMVCTYAGLSGDEVRDLLKKDAKLAQIKQQCDGMLATMARMNIAERIYAGDIATSKWFLEHLSPDFSKKVQVSSPSVVISAEDKKKALTDFLSQFHPVEERLE